MVKMKELYEKIAGDSTLQAKFGEILNDAEKAGRQATDLRLAAFAKEARIRHFSRGDAGIF